jgi:hypothetical protein
MGRLGQRKQIWDVQREFADDFTVVNESLLLCKFCDTIVRWRKKTRIHEHLQTKMHAERKEARLAQPSSALYDDQDDDEETEDHQTATAATIEQGASFFFKKHKNI